MMWMAAGVLWAGSAWAGNVELAYENFYLDARTGRAKIIIKITNNTADSLRTVIAECAFLNNERRALDTATLIASNVAAGQSAYANAWSARISGIEHAECRVSNY